MVLVAYHLGYRGLGFRQFALCRLQIQGFVLVGDPDERV